MNQKYIKIKLCNLNSWNIILETKHIFIYIEIYKYRKLDNIVMIDVEIKSKKRKNTKRCIWSITEMNPLPNKYKNIINTYIIMYILTDDNT